MSKTHAYCSSGAPVNSYFFSKHLAGLASTTFSMLDVTWTHREHFTLCPQEHAKSPPLTSSSVRQFMGQPEQQSRSCRTDFPSNSLHMRRGHLQQPLRGTDIAVKQVIQNRMPSCHCTRAEGICSNHSVVSCSSWKQWYLATLRNTVRDSRNAAAGSVLVSAPPHWSQFLRRCPRSTWHMHDQNTVSKNVPECIQFTGLKVPLAIPTLNNAAKC